MNTLHNINIERSILSSILFDPSLFETAASTLRSNVFYLPAHKDIFEAMLYLERNNQPIDQEFIKKRLNQEEKLDEDVIIEINATSPLPNITAYIRELNEKFAKREFVKLSSKINEMAIDQDLPVKDVVDLVQQKLFTITQDNFEQEFRESPEMVHSTLELIKDIKSRGNQGIVGLDTGFRELNNLTSGFSEGDLIIIAARPSMGKTAFCLNLAQNMLERQKGVAFFSLEMPAEQLILRMLSSKTSIPLQRLRVGDLEDDEWGRLSDASEEMKNSKFFVDDNGNADIHHVRSKLRKLKMQQHDISLCIIDYLQLMSSSSNRDRHIEVSEISRGLKLLARELQIPIIALSQLNRSLENRNDKRPMLSDLRESGAIEQDADLILFVYRDDVYKMREEKEKEAQAREKGDTYKSNFFEKPEEDTEIIIGKNRNGPIGVAHLIFHKANTRFVDSNYISPNEGKSAIVTFESAPRKTFEPSTNSIDLPKI